MNKKPSLKPDKRKIPEFFRAVQKEKSPNTVYYGKLIEDGTKNFVCFAAHNGDSSVLKERVLAKNDFNFSKISLDDFCFHVRPALARMEKEAFEYKLEFEAHEYNHTFAKKKFYDIVGPV